MAICWSYVGGHIISVTGVGNCSGRAHSTACLQRHNPTSQVVPRVSNTASRRTRTIAGNRCGAQKFRSVAVRANFLSRTGEGSRSPAERSPTQNSTSESMVVLKRIQRVFRVAVRCFRYSCEQQLSRPKTSRQVDEWRGSLAGGRLLKSWSTNQVGRSFHVERLLNRGRNTGESFLTLGVALVTHLERFCHLRFASREFVGEMTNLVWR